MDAVGPRVLDIKLTHKKIPTLMGLTILGVILGAYVHAWVVYVKHFLDFSLGVLVDSSCEWAHVLQHHLI